MYTCIEMRCIYMDQSRILIADDDREIREIIQVLLMQEGYEVVEARNGKEAIKLADEAIDLYILDIMMPYINGYEVCEQIRAISNAPILFLTAKGTQKDKAQGFSKGADDYLAKPFSYSELLVRVKAMLRRFMVYQGKQAEIEKRSRVLLIGNLRIEERNEDIYVDDENVLLTDIEYRLLHFLATHRYQTFSAEELFVLVWEEPYYTSANNTLMVHIRNIRKKIEENPQDPKHIKTVWGKGYRFD